MRSDGQTPPKKGMTRVSFLCDIHLPSHGALCHAESRQHGLCRAETGVVGQFSVELRGGETAETPRFAVCDQWFQRLQRSSHFCGGFFRVDL